MHDYYSTCGIDTNILDCKNNINHNRMYVSKVTWNTVFFPYTNLQNGLEVSGSKWHLNDFSFFLTVNIIGFPSGVISRRSEKTISTPVSTVTSPVKGTTSPSSCVSGTILKNNHILNWKQWSKNAPLQVKGFTSKVYSTLEYKLFAWKDNVMIWTNFKHPIF